MIKIIIFEEKKAFFFFFLELQQHALVFYLSNAILMNYNIANRYTKKRNTKYDNVILLTIFQVQDVY